MTRAIALAITKAGIRKLKPCKACWPRVDVLLPARGKITAQQARDAGCTFDDLVWIASALSQNDKAIERRLRHWMADCADHVLHIFERAHPTDMRVRDSIAAARAFVDGQISDAARDAAGDAARAAWAAAWAAGNAAGDAARAAASAAWAATGDAAWATASAASTAASDAAGAAAGVVEQQWQFDRLIAWFGESDPVALSAFVQVPA